MSENEVNITDQALGEHLADDGLSLTLGVNGEGNDGDSREGATTVASSVLRVADLASGARWTHDAAGRGGRNGR